MSYPKNSIIIQASNTLKQFSFAEFSLLFAYFLLKTCLMANYHFWFFILIATQVGTCAVKVLADKIFAQTFAFYLHIHILYKILFYYFKLIKILRLKY